MRTNSRAWLYSEESLRTLRNNIHFAPIAGRYKMMIRNMIKLLALHDIHTDASDEENRHGMYINTLDAKGNPRVQQSNLHRASLPPRPTTNPTEAAEEMRFEYTTAGAEFEYATAPETIDPAYRVNGSSASEPSVSQLVREAQLRTEEVLQARQQFLPHAIIEESGDDNSQR